MQDSRRVSGSGPRGGVQINTPDDPFSDQRLHAQIAAEVGRIRSAWLQRVAEVELTGSDFYDQFVQMLVETLDAHAKGYLSGVDRDELIPHYVAKLQRLGEGLYNDAQQKLQLAKDESLPKQLLSPESRRKIIDDSVANLLSGSTRRGLDSSFQTRRIREQHAHKTALAIKLAEGQLAKDIDRWLEMRDGTLFRIETRFEARYHYWKAEAVERVLRAASVSEPPGRESGGVSKWDEMEIEFLSDERVQTRMQDKTETRNYAEMGFMDKRNGKPNQSWVVLHTLAQNGGTLEDSTGVRKKWSAIEKHIQRIREALREHFALAGDPIPFVRGVGFRTRFKIRCAASFET